MGAGEIGILGVVIILAFIIFNIYFIFKILQFVIVSVNLYKKMINRQDATLKLLLDIRDNTKKYDKISSDAVDNSSSSANDDTYGNSSNAAARW